MQSGLSHLLKELVDLQDKVALNNPSLALSSPTEPVDDEEIPSDDDAVTT